LVYNAQNLSKRPKQQAGCTGYIIDLYRLRDFSLSNNDTGLSPSDTAFFKQNGYLIVKSWLSKHELTSMRGLAETQFKQPTEPWELEAQLGYPGAPGKNTAGSQTPRRLLGAYQRAALWQQHAGSPRMKSCLKALFNHDTIYLSQAHHNCLMTKLPKFSSDTGWHQDYRYWNFDKPELITAWLALGKEDLRNGGLQVIPGSHLLEFKSEQFDEKKFFLPSHTKNRAIIRQAQAIDLEAGELLFFHCNLLHCATRNYTADVKLSLVFTYHKHDNQAIKGTRSASQSEIAL